jgi:hypothetical protein
MAKKHVPRRGPNHQWTYPKSEEVLEECGMHMIDKYILKWRKMIAVYVVEHRIFRDCMESERKRDDGLGRIQCNWIGH